MGTFDGLKLGELLLAPSLFVYTFWAPIKRLFLDRANKKGQLTDFPYLSSSKSSFPFNIYPKNNFNSNSISAAISSPFTSASTSPQSTASVQSIDAEIDVLSCTTTPMPPLDGLRLAGNGLGSDSAGSSCWGGEEKDKKYFCQRCLNHKEVGK